MKAVILAAGRGTRMGHLTRSTPKPLLKVRGKTIIEHLLDSFPKNVNEIIIIISYRGEKIKKHIGKTYNGKRIEYVKQTKLNGTAKALMLSRPFFNKNKKIERLLVAYGDELPTKHEVAKCLSYKYSWLCRPMTHSISTGIVRLNKNRCILEIVEKRTGAKPPFLAAGGVMIIDDSIFKYTPWIHKQGKEYYMTSMMSQFIKNHSVHAIIGKKDLYFTSPRDIDRASKKIDSQ